MTHGLVLYVNSPLPSLHSLAQIIWTVLPFGDVCVFFFLMDGDGGVFFVCLFISLSFCTAECVSCSKCNWSAEHSYETLGTKEKKRKMPSTSMSMFCACSSAHHKCDVTIALDSCTSNKNENKKSGLFGFLLKHCLSDSPAKTLKTLDLNY